MNKGFLTLLSGLALLSTVHAQSAAGSSKVCVVPVGSIPKSVVKWGTGGEVEYAMAQQQTLPPADLQIMLSKGSAKEYQPFPMTLNSPSMPVPFGPTGLLLYSSKGAPATDPSGNPAPAMTIPTLQGPAFQLVFMWRQNVRDDWSKPLYLPLDLSETAFPVGHVYFLNLTQRAVRLGMPQMNQAKPLVYKTGVVVKPGDKAPVFNYKIDSLGANNQIEPVVFTGLRVDPAKRNVVLVYEGNEGKPVTASFIVPVKPPADAPKTTQSLPVTTGAGG